MVHKFKAIIAALQIPHPWITIRTKEIQTHTQANEERGKMKILRHHPMETIAIMETADIMGMVLMGITGKSL
jgi:hypothetical protein